MTFDEDRSTVRAGAAAPAMAECRYLALSLIRRAGHANSAAADGHLRRPLACRRGDRPHRRP
ncbi:MAG: hypothetical protein HY332_17490 [Chloroflexi bacterium]|nr:hypothetical protein [Chloroflexota bacterium]